MRQIDMPRYERKRICQMLPRCFTFRLILYIIARASSLFFQVCRRAAFSHMFKMRDKLPPSAPSPAAAFFMFHARAPALLLPLFRRYTPPRFALRCPLHICAAFSSSTLTPFAMMPAPCGAQALMLSASALPLRGRQRCRRELLMALPLFDASTYFLAIFSPSQALCPPYFMLRAPSDV